MGMLFLNRIWLMVVCIVAGASVYAQSLDSNTLPPIDTARVVEYLPENPRRVLRKNLDDIPRYFYHSRDYGSEALYNPVTLVLNMGYDINQLKNSQNGVFDFPFPRSAKYTFKNLLRPYRPIRDMGAWNWLKSEVLPISFYRKGAQWLPNYTLHLFGGGMTYTNISEWYDAHGVRRPRLMGMITVVTGQLMNEIIENQGWTGTNADPIADMYLFNLAGFILFTSPKVNQFFSSTLQMADWSHMPTFTLPNGTLQNQGQYFSLKYALPFHKPLRLFARLGMSTHLGLSYKFNKEYSISVGAGIRSYELEFLDTLARQVTVTTTPTAGVFLDRNNTVIASLVWSHSTDNFMHAQMYPGVLRLGKFSPGLWAIFGRDGYATFGLTSKYTFGLGIGGEVGGPLSGMEY